MCNLVLNFDKLAHKALYPETGKVVCITICTPHIQNPLKVEHFSEFLCFLILTVVSLQSLLRVCVHLYCLCMYIVHDIVRIL